MTPAAHEIYLKGMIKNCSTKRNLGFTLVELLVVISIISILAGALFMVINPVEVQRKAKEAVLKVKTSQLCLALNACGSAKDDARLCDAWNSVTGSRDWAELGTSDPTGDPPTSTYTLLPAPAAADSTLTVTGTYGTCIYECNFNFSDGSSLKLGVKAGATCL